jgi:hypothetical protein
MALFQSDVSHVGQESREGYELTQTGMISVRQLENQDGSKEALLMHNAY